MHFHRWKRRDFITVLGGAAAWPLGARAQQPARAPMPLVGFLSSRAPNTEAHLVAAFLQGLKDLGYIEGQNVAVEYRWAEDRSDRLPALAADLVRIQPAVIVTAGGSGTAVAAISATKMFPIVFLIGGDPVRLGLVSSLNRPGGNATGVTVITVSRPVLTRAEVARRAVGSSVGSSLLGWACFPSPAPDPGRSNSAVQLAYPQHVLKRKTPIRLLARIWNGERIVISAKSYLRFFFQRNQFEKCRPSDAAY